MRRCRALLGCVAAVGLVSVSWTQPAHAATRARLQVVAAENFWGSIATQLAGTRAQVTSIITNPDTDPHDYEAKPTDARVIAGADYVIVNGIGYDAWAQKVIDATPSRGRKELDVGKLVGIDEGGNPHQWYSPSTVAAVSDRIATDLERLDPRNAGYYEGQKSMFVSRGLQRYHDLIAVIKQRYAGTVVGATESIFAPLASALGLDLVTPTSFLNAVAEGTDPSGHDKAVVDNQIATKAIRVLVYNSQNATPDVRELVRAARAKKIPVTTVTETLTPAGASFQAWQVRQLTALQKALAAATGV